MADTLRAAISERLAHRLTRLGLSTTDLTDDLDLVRSGILDSLGFVDLIADLENKAGKQVDLDHAIGRKNATTIGGIVALFDEA